MITRLTSLSDNIVQFCRFLRLKGFSAGVEEEALALQALQYIDYSNSRFFFLALQAILCRTKAQADHFEELFQDYWKQLEKTLNAKEQSDPEKIPPAITPQERFKSLTTWLHGNKNEETEEMATYSPGVHLAQKDFSSVQGDEVDELMQYIKALSKRLAAKVNRRYRTSRQADRPDLRLTLRKNLRRGGELLDIVHRKPGRNRLKLLVLCDVSKSMELYTAFLIQFLYAFQQVYNRIETFVFSTTLQRVTPLLKQKNFSHTLEILSAGSEDWHSGTRIGESLSEFVTGYGDKLLTPKTIVIILSDGWDTGSTELIEKNMEIISSKSKKLIWLNPLAGYAGYRPDTAGMKAALPFIDTFASVHNAAGLRSLGKWL